jgi:hypothetical protein
MHLFLFGEVGGPEDEVADPEWQHSLAFQALWMPFQISFRPTRQSAWKRLQELLGHESFSTTLRYAQLRPDAHEKVIESWSRRNTGV